MADSIDSDIFWAWADTHVSMGLADSSVSSVAERLHQQDNQRKYAINVVSGSWVTFNRNWIYWTSHVTGARLAFPRLETEIPSRDLQEFIRMYDSQLALAIEMIGKDTDDEDSDEEADVDSDEDECDEMEESEESEEDELWSPAVLGRQYRAHY